MNKIIDEAAKNLRLAHMEADPQNSTSYFIRDNPWETLAEGRKQKWIMMAEAAFGVYMKYSYEILPVDSSDARDIAKYAGLDD